MPYQLQRWPLAVELELRTELFIELATELRRLLDDTTLDGAEELATPEQTLPVICGTSAMPPFLLIWNPKATLWPGKILAFQPRLDAV